MRVRPLLAAVLFAGALPAAAQNVPVDLELVLAVDVSPSVDEREGLLQRGGYVRAFADPRIAQAIRNGQHGRIAVTYLEWSRFGLWYNVTPWRVLASAEDALAYARELDNTVVTRGPGTSISGAVAISMDLLRSNSFDAPRRVIDITGDGPNSNGRNVALARDEAVAAGVVINGVAINDREITWYSLRDLDVYYEECVIGGPGSFVVAVDGFDSFAEAILRKLILEIADRPPTVDARQPRVIPAQVLGGRRERKYAPRCDIGERMQRMDQLGFPPGTPFQ